jgi:hypothetical protein
MAFIGATRDHGHTGQSSMRPTRADPIRLYHYLQLRGLHIIGTRHTPLHHTPLICNSRAMFGLAFGGYGGYGEGYFSEKNEKKRQRGRENRARKSAVREKEKKKPRWCGSSHTQHRAHTLPLSCILRLTHATQSTHSPPLTRTKSTYSFPLMHVYTHVTQCKPLPSPSY